jgi:hypothetical protein
MSLWKVSDEPTKDMMIFFYEEIEKGASYAAAMRSAKLRYIKESDNTTADPYYWSAFVLVADPGLRTGYPAWIWIVGGLIAVLVVWVVIRKRKKASSAGTAKTPSEAPVTMT